MQGCSIQSFRFCLAVSEGTPLQSLGWLLMSVNEEARHKPVGNKHIPFWEWWMQFAFLSPTKKQKSSRKLQSPGSLKCIRKIMKSTMMLNSFCHRTCHKLVQSKHKERGSTQIVSFKPHQFFQSWVQTISKSKVLTQSASWGYLLTRSIKTSSPTHVPRTAQNPTQPCLVS